MEETKQKPQADEAVQEAFQAIVFRLGDEEYGLNIDQVKEVVLTPEVTRVPLSPPFVSGVANVRGNVLAVVDLEKRFGLAAPQGEGKPRYTLVIESDRLNMGVLVRDVPDTVTVTPEQLEASPALIADAGAEGSYIKGLVKVGERLVILIDIFTAVSERELRQSMGIND